MAVSNGAVTVFSWLVNLTSVGGFIGWWVINCTYLFFRKPPLFFREMAEIALLCRLRIPEAGIRQEGVTLLRPSSAIPLLVGDFLVDVLPCHLWSPNMV